MLGEPWFEVGQGTLPLIVGFSQGHPRVLAPEPEFGPYQLNRDGWSSGKPLGRSGWGLHMPVLSFLCSKIVAVNPTTAKLILPKRSSTLAAS